MRGSLLILWVAAAQSALPQQVIPQSLIARLQRGQVSFATQYAEQQLAKDPGSPEAAALLGAVRSFQGRYAEALPLLEQGEGSVFYETYGLHYHAHALRGAGDGQAAAALRAQRRVLSGYPEMWEHYDLLYRVEDLRVAGDFLAALAAAEEAIAVAPERPAYYAAIADVYTDMGDYDAAWQALALAQRLKGERFVSEVGLASARLYLAQGHTQAVIDLLTPQVSQHGSDVGFWTLLGESRRRQGELPRVELILNRIRFTDHRSPELVALRARLLRDRGDLAGAQGLTLDALADLPGNPTLRAVAAELGVL